MGITRIEGNRKTVNRRLMLYAFELAPTLIIDCGNAANPHALFPYINQEELHNVHVIGVDLLYLFRDILKNAGSIAKSLGVHTIVITSFDRLFHYQDKHENRDILEHVWELIGDLSEEFDILVGDIKKDLNVVEVDKNGAYSLEPAHNLGYSHAGAESLQEFPQT